ncbi:hypothetical protein COU77_03840 [Candidatus Peregrinibacteria bacterium CG10_big_fil_rev_8_21_14_0_10_49_16]|nr:MAG: hypothetical protein COW95_00790 [Candidatus Peregrinibacteria bacterium CG22_combo_CG10-13_8_21_14_all_49_11]PIR51784.1 MAG: hypothetical protein COU77_03840 [Candidatus Peregrinibacteria bacterium CG10_big_fil_rev_8_21_14_0_10_49_16]
MSTISSKRNVEVPIKIDHNRAIIEGKTPVPFQTFVNLILQRKVFNLFKEWGKEPVIIDSDLLTRLASAPQDSQENRSRLVLVTLVVGILTGVFFFALGQAVLLSIFHMPLDLRDLVLIVAGLFAFTVLTKIMMQIQRRPKSEKLTETMEKLAGMVGK